MTLSDLAKAMERLGLRAVNIGTGNSDHKFMVSIRRDSEGFSTYYGSDISEICERAVSNGPQLPVSDELDEVAAALL